MSDELRAWYGLTAASVVGAVLSLASDSVGVLLLVIAAYLMLRFVLGIIRKHFGVDLLMGVAALVTWYLGAYFEGFLIIALYSISEIIESLAERRALRTLSSLKELIPGSVTVIDGGSARSVPPQEVRVGDVVLVRRGEAAVVDGVLLDEAGVFDTSLMTGEQAPVVLRRGERVVSGYVNVGDPVRVKAVAGFSDSALRLLVAEALRALERKSRIQRLLERVAPPYTAVLLSSYMIVSLVIGPYDALPIILAGCPSAFIVTSATLTATSIARLARRGVVVRGGAVLERASRVGAVVLDKTGTVTTGRLVVERVMPLGGLGPEDILRLAGGAAKGSRHPVSEALASASNLVPESVREVIGEGVEAVIAGRVVRIGKPGFAGFDGVGCGDLTPVYVSVDGEPAGVVCLREEVEDGVRDLIRSLKASGVKVVLASGDRKEKVSAIAESIGIDEHHSNMSPQDKARLVRTLKETSGSVAVVGDGINDAVALAEADLGIAVGRLGLTASVADAVLISGPALLLDLLEEARRHRLALIAGFATAAVIKAITLALGFSGAIPMAAVVALGDDGSTLLSLSVATVIAKGINRRRTLALNR